MTTWVAQLNAPFTLQTLTTETKIVFVSSSGVSTSEDLQDIDAAKAAYKRYKTEGRSAFVSNEEYKRARKERAI